MTIQDILGYTSLLTSTSLSKNKYFVKEFEMKKVFASLISRVTMELSLKILSVDHSLKKKWYFPQLLFTENT